MARETIKCPNCECKVPMSEVEKEDGLCPECGQIVITSTLFDDFEDELDGDMEFEEDEENEDFEEDEFEDDFEDDFDELDAAEDEPRGRGRRGRKSKLLDDDDLDEL